LIWLRIGDLVNTVISLRFTYNFWELLSSCTTGGFPRWAQLHGTPELLNGLSVRLILESVTKVYPDIEKLVKI
jgi:hypothetical protein